jgi:hypothetical protein
MSRLLGNQMDIAMFKFPSVYESVVMALVRGSCMSNPAGGPDRCGTCQLLNSPNNYTNKHTQHILFGPIIIKDNMQELLLSSDARSGVQIRKFDDNVGVPVRQINGVEPYYLGD